MGTAPAPVDDVLQQVVDSDPARASEWIFTFCSNCNNEENHFDKLLRQLRKKYDDADGDEDAQQRVVRTWQLAFLHELCQMVTRNDLATNVKGGDDDDDENDKTGIEEARDVTVMSELAILYVQPFYQGSDIVDVLFGNLQDNAAVLGKRGKVHDVSDSAKRFVQAFLRQAINDLIATSMTNQLRLDFILEFARTYATPEDRQRLRDYALELPSIGLYVTQEPTEENDNGLKTGSQLFNSFTLST